MAVDDGVAIAGGCCLEEISHRGGADSVGEAAGVLDGGCWRHGQSAGG